MKASTERNPFWSGLLERPFESHFDVWPEEMICMAAMPAALSGTV